MRFQLANGTFSSSTGLLGAGLLALFPNEPLIGWTLILAALTVFVSGVRIDNWHIRSTQTGWRSRMSPVVWMVIGIFGLIITTTTFYRAYSIYRDGWPLRFSFGTPLNFAYNQTIGGFEVWGVNGTVQNISGQEVKLGNAHIVSGQDGRRIPVTFSDGYGQYLDGSNFNPMPPDAAADFRALFKTDKAYISEQEFWEQWASITFVATYGDDQEYKRTFSKEELKQHFETHRPKTTPAPRMIPTESKLWADDVLDWSVSIETLPLFHFIPEKKIVVFQQFRLVNVSAKHKRIIDLEISVPPNGDIAPGVTFKTEYYRDSGYRQILKEAGKENRSRGWEFLSSPIELQPGQLVEGQIDFILPDSIIPIVAADPTRLRMESTTVTAIDRISGNKFELLLGEHFNALKGVKSDPRLSAPKNKGIFRPVFPEPEPGKPRPPGTRPEDVTFSDLLIFEFPNMVAMSSDRIERGEFADAKFAQFVVVQDNISRSEFYAVYTMENAQTFEVCKWFADNYKVLREEWRPAKPPKKGFGIEPFSANNDFPFTGQFYIYHEGGLTTEEQQELWNLYQTKGMNLTFRGPKYLKEKKEWLGPHLHK